MSGLHPQSTPAVIDELYRTAEYDWQAPPMRRDHRSVTLYNPPINATIFIAKEIPGRNAIELRPTDIGADGIDQCVPAPERLEKTRGCYVGLLVGKRGKPLIKFLMSLEKGGLLRQRKSNWSRRTHPWRRRFVDRAVLYLSKFPPWVAVRRMEPTAAEIDRTGRMRVECPRPPAKA